MKEAEAEGGAPGRQDESAVLGVRMVVTFGDEQGAGVWEGPGVGVSLALVTNVPCPALGAFALRNFTKLHEHLGSVCFTACMLSRK